MIMEFCRKNRGSISIFLLLVLLPMVTYATMIIDASRLQSAKTEISGAGDLAMSSAMADYEATLHELYGLFAMSPDEEQLKKNVQSYFEKNIRNSLGDEADKDYIKESAKKITDMAFSSDEIDINEYDFDNLINMNPENVEASYVKDSSLANPYILKRQIMEFMKYRGPISCANNILSKFAAFKDSSNQTTVVSNKVDYSTKLNSISDPCLETYELIEQYFKLSTDFDIIKDSLDSRYAKAKQLYQVATIVMVGDCKLNKDKIVFETIEDIQYDGETEEDILLDIETKLNEIISIDNNGSGALEQQFGSFETDDNNNYKFTPNKELADLDAAKSAWGLSLKEIEDIADSFVKYDDIRDPENDIKLMQSHIDSCNSTKAKYFENKQKIIEFKKYIDTYDKLVQDYSVHCQAFCNQTDDDDKKDEILNKYQIFWSKSSLNPLCLHYWQNYLGEVKNLYNTEYIVYADECVRKAYTLINEYAEKISALNSKAQEIESKLGVVLNSLNEIEAAKKNWKTSVDSVSDENIKSNFQSDYDAEKEKFDREKINNLKSIFYELKGKHAADEADVRSVTYLGCEFAAKKQHIGYINYYTDFNIVNKDTVFGSDSFQYTSNLSKGFKPTDDDEKQIKSNEFYKQIEEMHKNSQNKPGLNKDQKGEVNNVNNFAENGTNLNDSGSEVKREDTNGGNININLEPETSSNEMTSEQAEEFIKNKFKTITGNSSGNINNTQIEESGEKDSKKAGEEYSKKGNNAKDSLNKAQQFLSEIGRVADELGSFVYLEEYVTEMFSCDTDLITKDNKDASITTLAGKKMDKNNSEFYGSEIEYILWGQENPTANITYNYGLIYMIRFALNAIYAFTSVEIQSYALEIATAIAGWTVVGVPIVQAIVTIVFALAESAFDIYTLKQGESVPIYKSADTWVCSLTGLGKAAAQEVTKKLMDEAKEKVVEMSDEAFEKLESELNGEVEKGTKELTDYLTNTAENQINGIYSEVQNNIVKPFIDNLAQYVDVKETIDVDESIDEAFEKAKDSAESYVSGLGEGMQKEIASSLWGLFKEKCLENLKTQVKGKLNSKEPFTISELINEQMGTLNEKTKKLVNKYIGQATNKLKEGILDEGGKIIDSAKGQVKSIISENMDSLSESITSKIPSSSNGSTTGTNSITSKFNSLNYKEYCKIFVFIRIAADEKGVLNNTAKIIQCNVNKKKNVFCMGKAYTMVQISSDIRMNTLFPWAVSVDMDESNNEESINSDIKNAQSDSILIRYNAVNGY